MLVPYSFHENQAFKLRDLSVALQICFAQNAGCNRFLWNELIAINKVEYEAYKKYLEQVEAVKDNPDEVAKIHEVTRPSLLTFEVVKKILDLKDKHPFLKDALSQPLQQVAMCWARTMRGAVSGKNGFPKKKKFQDDSFCIPQGFEFDEANGRVRLPKIGWVRYYNSAKLKGKPKQITILRKADGWYMVVSCEITRYIDLPLDLSYVTQQAVAANVDPDFIIHLNADVGAVLAQKVKAALDKAHDAQTETLAPDGQDAATSLASINIAALMDKARNEVLARYALSDEHSVQLESMVQGLDVGVAIEVVLSSGASFDEIKAATDDYKKRQSRLDGRIATLQRQRSRKVVHSHNYQKLSQKIAKLFLKQRRIRDDFLHKLSSALVKNHDQEVFVCEGLNISGMSKSAKGTVDNPGKNVKQKSGLNRSILNMGWGKFLRMLEYKLALTGRKLIKVDPRNTSRTCSKCGCVSKHNRQTQARFKCVSCGYEANADLNAAVNIKNRFLASLTKSGKRKGQGMPGWPGASSRKAQKA